MKKVFSGDAAKARDLQLGKHSDYIILGKLSINYKSNPDFLNVISADINLEIKILSSENGVIINSAILTATGAGFSNSDAEKKALELLNDKINGFLRETF